MPELLLLSILLECHMYIQTLSLSYIRTHIHTHTHTHTHTQSHQGPRVPPSIIPACSFYLQGHLMIQNGYLGSSPQVSARGSRKEKGGQDSGPLLVFKQPSQKSTAFVSTAFA